jgi:hypothetical protein
MDKFVHEENLKRYRELLAGARHDVQRPQILKLLAEEEAKNRRAAGSRFNSAASSMSFSGISDAGISVA